MNSKLFQRAVEISRALKPNKVSGKSFHTSFAIRQGKIQTIGWNNYNKPHNCRRFGKYHAHKDFGTEYRPSLHSECSLLIRLGEEDLSGYEILNIRISNTGNVANSAPCPNCKKLLISTNPKRIFYSTSDGYEQLNYEN